MTGSFLSTLCSAHSTCRLTYLTNDPSQVLSHSWLAAEQDPARHWVLTPCCAAYPSPRAAGPWEAVAGAGRLVIGLKRHECVHLPAVSPTHSLSFSWPRRASRARFPSLWSCALCPPDNQPASRKAGQVWGLARGQAPHGASSSLELRAPLTVHCPLF